MKRYLFIALFAPVVGWCAPKPVGCPASLDVKNSVIAPAGWSVVEASGASALDRIGFSVGPATERAALVPDKTQNKKGESKDVWNFQPGAAETIWASCFYVGTTLSIARPMEQGVRRCEVRYRTVRSGARISVAEAHCE